MVFRELDWYMQKHETRPPTYILHCINWKWIKDLNVSHDTITGLAENISSKISDIPCSNIFADVSPRGREIKEKTNKCNYIKWKSMAEETIINMKRTNYMGEHFWQWYICQGLNIQNL